MKRRRRGSKRKRCNQGEAGKVKEYRKEGEKLKRKWRRRKEKEERRERGRRR